MCVAVLWLRMDYISRPVELQHIPCNLLFVVDSYTFQNKQTQPWLHECQG